MAKKERSFFGKIMGANLDDDSDTDLEVEKEEVEMDEAQPAEELLDEDELEALEEEDDDDEDEEEVEVQVESGDDEEEEAEEDDDDLPPAPEKKSGGDHEEWLSDYEGQLNIDMYQTKDNVIIKSTIAGVRPEDIDVTVANDMVTIKGVRKREEKIVEDDYFYQECYWGNFSRSVIVPVDIDSENIEADLRDGILTIVIPKAAKAKTKKIKVKGL